MNALILKKKPVGNLLSEITFNKPPQIVTLIWNRESETENPEVLQHGGATYGFRSHLSICPEQKWVVTAMANFGFDPGASDVAVKIAKYLKSLAK